MSAFTPIPNSLFAGAYNGSFFPHAAVTFSTRAFLVVIRQEICVDGRVDSVKVLEAVVSGAALLDAGYVDALPLEGQSVTLRTLAGEVVTIKPLEALSKTEAMNLDARVDSEKALQAIAARLVGLDAGFRDTISINAETRASLQLQAEAVTILALEAGVEEC